MLDIPLRDLELSVTVKPQLSKLEIVFQFTY